MFEKIADLLIGDINDDIFLNGTSIEIIDFNLKEINEDLQIMTFYISDGGNFAGVSFNSDKIKSMSLEHLRDAFIIALL